MTMTAPTSIAPSAAEQPSKVPRGVRRGGGTYSTPAARKLAKERGLSISELLTDADGVRVSLLDVITAAEAASRGQRASRRDPEPAIDDISPPLSRTQASLSVQIEVHDRDSYRAKLLYSIVQAVHAKVSAGRPDIHLGLISHLPDAERHVVISVSQDLSADGMQRLMADAPQHAVTSEDVVVHDLSALGAEQGCAPLGDSVLAFQAGAVREILALRPPFGQMAIGTVRVLDLSVTYDSSRTPTRDVSAALNAVANRMVEP